MYICSTKIGTLLSYNNTVSDHSQDLLWWSLAFVKCPFSSYDPHSPPCVHWPGNLHEAPSKGGTRRKTQGRPTHSIWAQGRFLKEAVSVCGSVSKQAPPLPFSLKKFQPRGWACTHACIFLVVDGYLVPVDASGLLLLLAFSTHAFFPVLAAVISPLDYCNPTGLPALSFALWITNPFSTMYQSDLSKIPNRSCHISA